jgi:hypothetical protein
MKTLLAFLILTSAVFAFAQSEAKCFQNESLQGKQIVNFQRRGKTVFGTFRFENGESELARGYKFTGLLGANGALPVRFENAELPDVAPSVIKSLTWMLLEKGGSEILRIKFYGKNYETNRYAEYSVDFVSCGPKFEDLLKIAKVVQFKRGESSAEVPLSFKNTTERKVFSILARRGQTLEIEAAGSKISVYLPGGGLYEFVEWESGVEKTFTPSAIDRASIKSLPRSGKYLVVLQKMAAAARPVSVNFKVTN